MAKMLSSIESAHTIRRFCAGCDFRERCELVGTNSVSAVERPTLDGESAHSLPRSKDRCFPGLACAGRSGPRTADPFGRRSPSLVVGCACGMGRGDNWELFLLSGDFPLD